MGQSIRQDLTAPEAAVITNGQINKTSAGVITHYLRSLLSLIMNSVIIFLDLYEYLK